MQRASCCSPLLRGPWAACSPTGAATGIVGAAGGLGWFFPPLLVGVVKDATGDFVLGFVFLVAFAWMCAGMAVAVLEPGQDQPPTASAQ